MWAQIMQAAQNYEKGATARAVETFQLKAHLHAAKELLEEEEKGNRIAEAFEQMLISVQDEKSDMDPSDMQQVLQSAREIASQPSDSESSKRLDKLLRLDSLVDAGWNELVQCISLANKTHQSHDKAIPSMFQHPNKIAERIWGAPAKTAFFSALRKANALGLSICDVGYQIPENLDLTGKSPKEKRSLLEKMSDARTEKIVEKMMKLLEEKHKVVCLCRLAEATEVMGKLGEKEIHCFAYMPYSSDEKDFGKPYAKDAVEKVARAFPLTARSFYIPDDASTERAKGELLSAVGEKVRDSDGEKKEASEEVGKGVSSKGPSAEKQN